MKKMSTRVTYLTGKEIGSFCLRTEMFFTKRRDYQYAIIFQNNVSNCEYSIESHKVGFEKNKRAHLR